MYASIASGALHGVDALPVTVEVDQGPGMQNFHLAGLPDGAVREARVRVKSAIENAGWVWPMRRLTLNLAPADLRKDGTAYDLPIALALLAACEELSEAARERLSHYLVAGELSLDGELRSVRGALPLAICARDQGFRGILLPRANAREAALVQGIEVIACQSLVDAVEFAEGRQLAVWPTSSTSATEALRRPEWTFDMADVRGQSAAKRALEVAAAGGHNVLMVGPPGSGKTMLAKRVLTILPEMTFEEALETTKIYSVSGLTHGGALMVHRPFRAPHHTISDVGMVGGGSGMPRPGEISLAHHGVLFLDELPEFRRHVLEVMRQPLEDGEVHINRSLVSTRYPARMMLVASMNPCPCGHLGDPQHACVDTPMQIAAYRNRISGPLLDRIDIQLDVPAIRFSDLRADKREESSETIRARVDAARARQLQRFEGRGITCNAHMESRELKEFCAVDAAGERILGMVIERLGMSARAYHRILKVARTIADLDDSDEVLPAHLTEAVQYRRMDRRSP